MVHELIYDDMLGTLDSRNPRLVGLTRMLSSMGASDIDVIHFPSCLYIWSTDFDPKSGDSEKVVHKCK